MAIPHAAFLTSMARTLSHRQNAINDTKKMMEGSSSTPSVRRWKFPRNDIDRTASTITAGAQEHTAARTRSKTAITNRKITAVAPQHASTSLYINQEMQPDQHGPVHTLLQND